MRNRFVSSSPIAVLDSGAGGLSVVRALRTLLPEEELHYFADTAHLPYGSKSPELIEHLALKMARKLFELSRCKVMVLACHTISTLCTEKISDALEIPVIGITKPSIAALTQLVGEKKNVEAIGVISTKATLCSRAYQNAWPSIDTANRINFHEQAAGHLVSLVEDPDVDFNALASVIGQLLSPEIKNSDGVLIGCTHFSALIPALQEVLKPGCTLVDAANFVAEDVRAFLVENTNFRKASATPIIAYVSDNPQRFQIIARRFITEPLMIEWLRNYARS